MSWSQERRLDYIDLLLLTQGRVRRGDLMEAFGVSMPQASGDIQAFLAEHPRAMRYDKSAKQYVPMNSHHKPARKSMRDAKRREALILLTRAVT